MKTPWAEWLAEGRRLGFKPAEFWRLSVWEWRALNARRPAPPTTDELKDLMRARPDDAPKENA